MSIVRLQRVTLCGMVKEKEAILDQLQCLGCLHLSPLRATSQTDGEAASERPETAYRALRHLGDTPDKRLQIRFDPDFNIDAVVEKAEENRLALIAAQR